MGTVRSVVLSVVAACLLCGTAAGLAGGEPAAGPAAENPLLDFGNFRSYGIEKSCSSGSGFLPKL
ncbi:MAG: hypothetical protein N3A38_05185, partial [Planctomycetota bacterium]|nr:hypothetical protein [Planctomycetota bacterium]